MARLRTALHKIDVDAAGLAGPTLAAWFASPYWGFPPERPCAIKVRTATTEGISSPSLNSSQRRDIMAVADAIRDTARPQAAQSEEEGAPIASSDSALDARKIRPFEASELLQGPFSVKIGAKASQPRDLAEVLAELLILRLQYVFGEDLMMELRRAGHHGARRFRSTLASGTLLSPHVLLPTTTGRIERLRLAANRSPALVPTVAYAPVVAHVLAPLATVYPVKLSYSEWGLVSATDTSNPGPTKVERLWAGHRLTRRRLLYLLARPVLLTALSVVRVAPVKINRGYARRIAAFLDGSFRQFPSRTLLPTRKWAGGA